MSHDNPPYVILDDLDDFLPSQHDRYVEVNPIVGITAKDAQQAIEILAGFKDSVKIITL